MQSPAQKKNYAQDSSHYSAFISYRHAPADTAAAADLQKRLELYHIPGQIRRKTGRNRIGKIFRDKEELFARYDFATGKGLGQTRAAAYHRNPDQQTAMPCSLCGCLMGIILLTLSAGDNPGR